MRKARGYAPLETSKTDLALVRRIVDHARTHGRGWVAGFDLDGCLFDTRPRQVHIFRELASQRGWAALTRVNAEHFLDWSLRNTMANAGLPTSWIDDKYPVVRKFWEDRFFAGEYVLYDHAMPGAARLVRAVHDAGLEVVYLTGRDIKMRLGTEEALRRFGFPYDRPAATLLTKPTFEMDDTEFKHSAMETIGRLGEVAIYLDNEPANVNLFRDRHPDALVVFVETDHSPKPVEPAAGIPWLRSFLTEAV